MSNDTAAPIVLVDHFGDALTDAVAALARLHEANALPATEALAVFLGLSDACAAWFGDGKGCDGCERVLSAEACDYAGLFFAEDEDHRFCPFCKAESEDAWAREAWALDQE